MRKLVLLISIALAVSCCSSSLWAYTVTFDDTPIGQDLSYYHQQHGLRMYGWEVIDSVTSGWGTPQSGTQAAVWNGDPRFALGFSFYFVDGVSEYTAQSVGAYFTTKPGVVLEMRGHTASGAIITTTIGDINGSWSNHYVEINSAMGDIRFVHIAGLNSPDEQYHFAMDDLTIEPVPEPSSIFALVGGIAGLGGFALRRRRS
jgi:hypothetical protein